VTTQQFAIAWVVLTMALFWIVGTYGPRLVRRLRARITRRRVQRQLGYVDIWHRTRNG
jgi:hypothetical protein